jgi:futalosine hydrolase
MPLLAARIQSGLILTGNVQFCRMKITVVAATNQEIEPLRAYLTERLYLQSHHSITCLVTGIGLMNTTFALTRHLCTHKPEFVIQAGIAGSFSPLFPPGTVVAVKDEMVADLGVMENDQWKDHFDMHLSDPNQAPNTNKKLVNVHHSLLEKLTLCQVSAISVNEVTTSQQRIETYIAKYSPVIESMEGAAVHKVCLEEGIAFIQLRAISNLVGVRDKTQWKIPQAIKALNEQVILLINKIAEHQQT